MQPTEPNYEDSFSDMPMIYDEDGNPFASPAWFQQMVIHYREYLETRVLLPSIVDKVTVYMKKRIEGTTEWQEIIKPFESLRGSLIYDNEVNLRMKQYLRECLSKKACKDYAAYAWANFVSPESPKADPDMRARLRKAFSVYKNQPKPKLE